MQSSLSFFPLRFCTHSYASGQPFPFSFVSVMPKMLLFLSLIYSTNSYSLSFTPLTYCIAIYYIFFVFCCFSYFLFSSVLSFQIFKSSSYLLVSVSAILNVILRFFLIFEIIFVLILYPFLSFNDYFSISCFLFLLFFTIIRLILSRIFLLYL